jgi:hypothetical protein
MHRLRTRPNGPLKPLAANQSKLLQVADVYASAAFNALTPGQYGLPDETYMMALQHQLYRRGSMCVSYGLKFFPGDRRHLQALHGELPWLGQLGF